jgi:hypothetical protein
LLSLPHCPGDIVTANIDLINMHRNLFSYTEAMQSKTKIKKAKYSLSCFTISTGISLPNKNILYLFLEIKRMKIRKFLLKVHYSVAQQFFHFIFSFFHISSDIFTLLCSLVKNMLNTFKKEKK